jgi:hypothetical protein
MQCSVWQCPGSTAANLSGSPTASELAAAYSVLRPDYLPLKPGPSVQFGLSPEKMISNGALADFFRVLTTTPDQNGKIYVSSVEARKYPIYGTQWHPGKSALWLVQGGCGDVVRTCL